MAHENRAPGRLDRTKGRIPPAQDFEWSIVVGESKSKYPWGDQWPPPAGAGNYADSDSDLNPKLDNYRDGFNRTAPVGSFKPNGLGLYDLGGNVSEWCMDWYQKVLNPEETREEIPTLNDDGGRPTYRVLRGGAWNTSLRVYLRSSSRNRTNPTLVMSITDSVACWWRSGAP